MPLTKYYDLNEAEIISDYKAGILNKNILAKHRGLYPRLLYKILREHKVPCSRRGKLTGNQWNEVFKLCETNISYQNIANIYGVKESSIREMVHKHNILKKNYRKVPTNDNFFENMNSEAQYWMLGWYFTDGCNLKQKNISQFCLNIRDQEVIDKFDIFLPGSIYFDNYNRVQHKVYSKKICIDLEKLGCIPRKSLVLKYPNIGDQENYHKWFIRGVLEGDGWVSIKNTKTRRNVNIGICSASEQFIDSLSAIINQYNNINPLKSFKLSEKSNVKIYRICITEMHAAYKFLQWIYQDADQRCILLRKYNKYREFKQAYENKFFLN